MATRKNTAFIIWRNWYSLDYNTECVTWLKTIMGNKQTFSLINCSILLTVRRADKTWQSGKKPVHREFVMNFKRHDRTMSILGYIAMLYVQYRKADTCIDDSGVISSYHVVLMEIIKLCWTHKVILILFGLLSGKWSSFFILCIYQFSIVFIESRN